MTSFILRGLGWRMLRLRAHTHTHTHTHIHTYTYERAHTFLNTAGSNLHHVLTEVETMKIVSMSADSQISSLWALSKLVYRHLNNKITQRMINAVAFRQDTSAQQICD